MAESVAHLVDEILPEAPMRQWVSSFPYPLRYLFAAQPRVMRQVLGIAYRAFSTHLIKKAGYSKQTGHTGAITLVQCFGSALNLNIHFHMLFLGDFILNPMAIPGFNGSRPPQARSLPK